MNLLRRFSYLFIIFLISAPSEAKQDFCPIDELLQTTGIETHAPEVFLDVDRFENIYRIRKENGSAEPTVTLRTYESARNYVQHFPALKKFGFNPQNHTEWTRVTARLERSSFYGKFVGWEEKLGNGNFARYRFDYEPDQLDPVTQHILKKGRGAHWNIEMSVMNSSNRRETLKLAVQFLCSGSVCSEAQALTYLNRMNR